MWAERFRRTVAKIIGKEKKLIVSAIAKEMGCSKTTLEKEIKKEMGISPKKLLNMIIMENTIDGAKKGEQLTTIALKHNRNPEAFGRVYKREAGENFYSTKRKYMSEKDGGFFDSYIWKCLLEKINKAMLYFLLANAVAILLVIIPSTIIVKIGLVLWCIAVFPPVLLGSFSMMGDIICLVVKESEESELRYRMYWEYIRKMMVMLMMGLFVCCGLLLNAYLFQ